MPCVPRIAARPRRAPTAKASAPIDLTGYWVAFVNEDWRYRMVTPAKGDYRGVPITMDALKIVNAWDPAADEAAGNQCKSYGAAAIMRVPGRIHVTLAGRQHAASRHRRRHADTAVPFRVCARSGGQADVAGSIRRTVGATRSRPWESRGAIGGVADGRDHEHAGRLSPQERCAVQRERHGHRILRRRLRCRTVARCWSSPRWWTTHSICRSPSS